MKLTQEAFLKQLDDIEYIDGDATIWLQLVWAHLDKRGMFDYETVKGKIVEGETKTKNGKRVIPMTDTMFANLIQHRSRQTFEKLRAGRGYEDNGYVFANEIGCPIEPSYLRDVYERILKTAGVPHYKFHTIRHTFATRAIENNMPVKVVSQILGHSSVQLTMDLYCHPSVSAKRSVMEKLEKL